METRNYLANAAGSPPPKPSSPSNGYPQSATPGVNEATTPGPFWFYKVGEELRKVITEAGLTPSDNDLGQLLEALNLRGVELSPAGSVMGFTASTAPTGWIKANGAEISRTSYAALWSFAQSSGNLAASEGVKEAGQFGPGDGSTTFTLPDLRGEFVRGWDDGKGIDSGRGFGTQQGAYAGSITFANSVYEVQLQTGTPVTNTLTINGKTIDDGNTETTDVTPNDNRPRNIALLYCIKY
ncbi:hypothetical protein FAZ79_00395 [Guyparkeria sp. SB14A]|uniref:phage tail protein n=1 Tax=Guyparkeria sp. SB14A TaxID=2571147 RepID=UPI0010AD1F03|nr:phage tail protein [Guyparkeria sp. SB14A]TKA91799.1 hypothetical protein FAZ79_00395 [Guyparkeria sp. SB14A]